MPVMLFTVLHGYHSIREPIAALPTNGYKLSHLGLIYVVGLSTFTKANRSWRHVLAGNFMGT